MNDRLALYFGCYEVIGHFLYEPPGHHVSLGEDYIGFPWSMGLLDSGLLRNRRVSDEPDGRVHWTCGGRVNLWFAFFWWDRSVDRRGNSNSGFYVRGFPPGEHAAAFQFAREQWPAVVARQRCPLALQVEVPR